MYFVPFVILLMYCPDQAPEEALWDQPHGGTDIERHHSVLCLCEWTTEGPLPQHTLFKGECCMYRASKNSKQLMYKYTRDFSSPYCNLKPTLMFLFSFRSISPSSSVTPPRGLSFWQRKSPNLATRASTFMQGWCRNIGTVCSMTSEMGCAETWSVQVGEVIKLCKFKWPVVGSRAKNVHTPVQSHIYLATILWLISLTQHSVNQSPLLR